MLSELAELSGSDEEIWGHPELSFSIKTRESESDELAERTYTFSYSPEWGEWSFIEYEERRTPDVEIVRRNWRRESHIGWDDIRSRGIEVPPDVSEKLEEMLDLEELTLSMP